MPIFQVVPYLGNPGLKTKTLLKSLLTMDTFPKEIPRTCFVREDKVEKAVFTALRPTPALKYSVKYWMLVSVVPQKGSVCCS